MENSDEFTHKAFTPHPQGPIGHKGAKIRLGQVAEQACGDGKWASRKEDNMPSPHPAGAAAVRADETARAFSEGKGGQ